MSKIGLMIVDNLLRRSPKEILKVTFHVCLKELPLPTDIGLLEYFVYCLCHFHFNTNGVYLFRKKIAYDKFFCISNHQTFIIQ